MASASASPKTDTSRGPWLAVAKRPPTRRPMIPLEKLQLVDEAPPKVRTLQGSRYDALFAEHLKTGKPIKAPSDHTPGVAAMLRHWLQRKRITGYAVRSASYANLDDKTGRVWLIKVKEGAAAAATPTRATTRAAAPAKPATPRKPKGGAA